MTESLRERMKAASIRADGFLAKLFKRDGVPDTPELQRIVSLPRREWTEEVVDGLDAAALAEIMTKVYKTPTGSKAFWPRQAKALQELHDYGGSMAVFSVGDGKTLVSAMAPVVCEIPGRRALLVVPAKLRKKTHREFKALAEDFDFEPPRVVSYEKISRAGSTELLEEWAPELLIFDECHRLKNKDAAVTRRFKAYVEEHNPRVLPMSGTMTSRKLADFAHLLLWAVPLPRTPLPQKYKDFEKWSAAFDVIKPHENRFRADPGELTQLYNDEERKLAEKEPLKACRRALRRRIYETPGIVASERDSKVAASLNIRVEAVEGYNSHTEALFLQLNHGQLPNGDPVTEFNLPARWRTARELSSGFWYEWDPAPPPEWLGPRRAWKSAARDILKRHIGGIVSELVLTNIVDRGAEALRRYHIGADVCNELIESRQAWQAVRDTFKANSVPRWVDDRMLNRIAQWKDGNKGIVWISEVALGKKLDEMGVMPYYGAQGLDSRGKFIEDDKDSRCIAASVGSNAEGRNLQYRWSNSLIVSPPPTGTVVEQLLGRTHRNGQPEDEVWATFLVGCRTEWDCWLQANIDADYQEAKLMLATKMLADMPFGTTEMWRTPVNN